MNNNIFLDKNQPVNKQKRNGYDLSKLVNGTYKQGFLYPVDWTEVTFGESIKLDIRAALRTMPMVWPIQTPIIVKFYSFYVRYRNLWKNYEDFRFNNKQVTPPFIGTRQNDDMWKTGEIADHLGVPTTYFGDNPSRSMGSIRMNLGSGIPSNWPVYYMPNVSNSTNRTSMNFASASSQTNYVATRFFWKLPVTLISDIGLPIQIFSGSFVSGTTDSVNFLVFNSERLCVAKGSNAVLTQGLSGDNHYYLSKTATCTNLLTNTTTNLSALLESSTGNYYLAVQPATTHSLGFVVTALTLEPTAVYSIPSGSYDITDASHVTNPFSGNRPYRPISALPFRAYESIYRSYFQDLINEPFILNGEPQYNRYITNDGDGIDQTPYHLFRRNWEADFLTSCRPSPQQGLAPIVGLQSDGTITLQKSSGDTYSVRLVTDNDDVVTSVDFATQKGESDHSVRRTLLELASTGITINSIRNVNALQKWLEANYRRGLKFKDQVFSNTGVKLKYDTLDMPEFLGGFSVPLDVNSIAQTSSTVSGQPLGQLAGAGFLGGSNRHTISRFCDEEGLVMTLMCITPLPVYSQILNPAFIKDSPLDFYNTQFGKIPPQPITYEVVCPVQAQNEGVPLQDTFGYQRPWYWLISSYDEVHGHFRDNMASFLQQRVFGSTPQLGADFLHIDQDSLTDVFVIDDEDAADPFYGQIRINKFKKSPIPRFYIPSM